MSTGTRLLLAVIGGFVCGLGAALCLKAGGSTGGMDIVANFLQVKKQLPFTKIQSTVDTIIILSSIILSVIPLISAIAIDRSALGSSR